jgi:diguanylate cyclase (GGDEF)-like protein
MSKASAPRYRDLPRAGRAFVGAVMLAALLAVAVESTTDRAQSLDLTLFAIALGLCAGASLFEVFAPGHHSFQPNLVIFFWAAVLSPPWALAILAAACFVPGRVIRGSRWYMTAFNVANYTLGGVLAHEIASDSGAFWSHSPSAVVGGLLGAAAAFVALNHLMIVAVIRTAQRRPLREAARVVRDGWSLDLALAMTGAVLALLWSAGRPFVALAAGPMLLIYRALWIPMLRHKSQTDPKTGLFNSEHFTSLLNDAVDHAVRHREDLSVVMFDLDHLRHVNNRCGHLAGDRLIRDVATVLSEVCPPGGVAARFGGEEFCVLLPGHVTAEARAVAENARLRVEALSMRMDDAHDELHVTISGGVASYPEHGDTANGLLGAADAAVYDAKLGGRNRIRSALPPETRELLASPSGPLELPPDFVPDPLPAGAPREDPALERRRQPVAPDSGSDPAPGLEPVGVELPLAADDGPAPPAPPPQAPATTQRLRAYVGLLCAAAVGVAFLGDPQRIADKPLLFLLLVGAVLALDLVRIDIFERATISPATVPTLASAYLFGPLGPIVTEAVILAVRVLRREVAVDGAHRDDDGLLLRWTFDFGALGLAGAGAASLIAVLPSHGKFAVFGGLVAGGLAYYVVNVTLLAIVMAFAEGQSPVAVWRERLAWLWTHYIGFGVVAGTFVVSQDTLGLYVFLVFGLPMVMLWVSQKQYVDRSRSSVTELRRSHDELALANKRLRGLLEDNQALLGRMHRSYLSTITSLARTIEAKDPYTGGHTERVAQIARMLAVELGFDDAQLRAVDVGSVIHDIGKIGIPDNILLKPGKLDPEELAEMRRHPEISSYIVAELELPAIVKQMVRGHHERYDGTGYPDGLAGDEIPLAARILSVADALDAMTSDRPYRRALPLEDARAEVEAQAGRQFCPRVVAALGRVLDSNPAFFEDGLVPEAASPAATSG